MKTENLMLKKVSSYFSHEDNRGSLTGIINEGTWKESNFITSKAGAIRGNHFHKETTELFFIVEGEIKVNLQDIQKPERQEEHLFKKGDIFLIYPNTLHTFEIIKPSSWINFLDKTIDSDSPDIHRL